MKVLLISHTCQSRGEGRPKAEWLGRMGIDLRILVPDRWRNYGQWRRADGIDDDASYQLNVGKVRWPWSGPGQWYLHWYPELAAILREFRPDVIDLWEEPWGLVSAHACWLRNRLVPNAHIIAETEQNVEKKLPFPFESFRSFTLRNAAYVIGRNAEAIEIVRRKGYRGAAGVVPNAVDEDLFRPLDREAARRALGISGMLVGYVGRLVEEKGLEDLVRALPHLPSEVKAVLVGSGPFQPELEQCARELGVEDRVHFLPARPLEELPMVMNALDAFVLPSRTTARWKEQFGRVIIEAHACGISVVGSDSGAIPEVIGEGGLIFPEGQPLALATAIRELWAAPAKAAELGRKGRKQVLSQYTWRSVAERMHGIYTEVLEREAVATPATV